MIITRHGMIVKRYAMVRYAMVVGTRRLPVPAMTSPQERRSVWLPRPCGRRRRRRGSRVRGASPVRTAQRNHTSLTPQRKPRAWSQRRLPAPGGASRSGPTPARSRSGPPSRSSSGRDGGAGARPGSRGRRLTRTRRPGPFPASLPPTIPPSSTRRRARDTRQRASRRAPRGAPRAGRPRSGGRRGG